MRIASTSMDILTISSHSHAISMYFKASSINFKAFQGVSSSFEWHVAYLNSPQDALRIHLHVPQALEPMRGIRLPHLALPHASKARLGGPPSLFALPRRPTCLRKAFKMTCELRTTELKLKLLCCRRLLAMKASQEPLEASNVLTNRSLMLFHAISRDFKALHGVSHLAGPKRGLRRSQPSLYIHRPGPKATLKL